jgi:glycosyltransferase involved in cell wall biosynthesis
MPKKIAFIKFGGFSHTNASVIAALRQYFPEYEVEVVDVAELLGHNHTAEFFNAVHMLKYYGRDLLSGRRSFKACYFRTPHMFARIKRQMRKRLGPDLSRYVFSFQTQSLYDASVPSLPHFVYTDHTHLTNLYYPGFDRSKLFARAWVDLEASLYRNATRTFTMSQHVRRSLLEHYRCDPERVSCVFAGSNLASPLVPLQNDNYRNQRILFAGVDWERKGGPDLVAAFKTVQQRHPNAHLTIVGCSPQLDLRNCTIVGRVPLELMKNYYAEASIFCLPTRLEPFGIVFVESLLNKIPVVATNLGAIPEIVENGKSGYLVEPNNSAVLARALSELLFAPEKCSRFGQYGHQAIQERYSWDSAGKRIGQDIAAAMLQVAPPAEHASEVYHRRSMYTHLH